MFACRCVHEHLGKFCGATCQQELRVWMPPHRTKRIHSIDLPHDLSVCFGEFHMWSVGLSFANYSCPGR